MATPYSPFSDYSYPPVPVMSSKDTPDPDALFTHTQQKWQENIHGSCWGVPPPVGYPPMPPVGPARLIFDAYDRSYGSSGPSSDDHTWISLRSQPLIDLLRSETSLKTTTNPTDPTPGLDARHIFLQLDILKEKVAKLEEHQTPKQEALDLESKPHANSNVAAPLVRLEGVEKLGLDVTKAARPISAKWLLPLASVFSKKVKRPIPEPVVNTEPTYPAPIAMPYSIPVPSSLPPLPVAGQLSELLRFVEQHFTETRENAKHMQDEGHISYQLLWTMCAPDTIIQSRDEITGKPIGIRVESWTYGQKGDNFTLHGTTYEWNGKMFSTKEAEVIIPRFKGLIKTSRLPIQVLSNETRTELIVRGRIYTKYSKVRHLQYSSDIYVPGKDGESPLIVQAHSRVMVDPIYFARLGFKTSSGYGFQSHYECPVLLSQLPSQRRTFSEQMDESFEFSDDILCLMPPAQLGYSFSTRLWGHLLVEDLSEVAFNEHSFDRILLPDEYKEVIKAQVETYALNGGQLMPTLQGNKWDGMVMVLHGNPGTGKSFTAEAISEHLKLPLYKISIGDILSRTFEFEGYLRNAIKMAATWNAVVLFEEADVILEAYEKSDQSNSSLVSAFLRMLEYQTGVLILESGSIQNFNKVLTSRFTAVLHYPDLDQDARVQVWRKFLKIAHVEVGAPGAHVPSDSQCIPHENIMELAGRSMNGHAIEQHVRDSLAIAIAQKETLGLKHLEKVIGVKEKMKLN